MISKIIVLFLILINLTSCTVGCGPEMEPNLCAQREAPIGWVRFKTFPDCTFTYSRGRGDNHKGTFILKGDTLFLSSTDTTIHCDKVVIGEESIQFIGEDTPGFASINVNKLTK